MDGSKRPAPPPPPGGGFPTRVALVLGCTVVLLAAAHFYKDRTKGIDPHIFADAFRLRWPKVPVPVAPLPTTVAVQTKAPGAPPPISSVMFDDSLALNPFFEALWHLEQGTSSPSVVTILHYGYSPTTADLITGDVRAILQERFGDAGQGFNLAAKPWAWYGHRDVDISDSGWQSSQEEATGVGRYKQGSYGLGGAMIAGAAGAHTTFRLTGSEQTAADFQYLAGPGGGSFTVTVRAGDGRLGSLGDVDTSSDTIQPASKLFSFPPETRSITLTVTSGTVKMFGVDFHRGNRGVIYDSLGLNGATTTVLSRTFDPALWSLELRHAHPQLIIINYGTNESQFSGLVKTLDKELRMAIARAREAAPGVPILIMSPMDRGQRAGINNIETMEAIPQIVAIQQRVAAETGAAFFNTFEAMGGDGTMARWYAAKPRLVTADLIHPTPQGARMVAELLVKNLYAGYDRWKRMHGIAIPVPAAPQQAETAGVPTPSKVSVGKPNVAKPSAGKTARSPSESESNKPGALKQ